MFVSALLKAAVATSKPAPPTLTPPTPTPPRPPVLEYDEDS